MALKPKELTLSALQELIKNNVSYPEIMEMYGFSSDRYFKEVLKTLGYRLLRGKLWVLADELWLNKSSLPKIKGEPKKYLTDEEKQTCADLHKQGKTIIEIVEITGIPYHFAYKWADIDAWRKQNSNYKKKTYDSKNKYRAPVKSKERAMPPINPPGQVVKIHADIDQLERHLQETLRDKLSPVIGPLSMRRPPINYTSQDQLS